LFITVKKLLFSTLKNKYFH